ncbi:MAG: ATP-binding protein [Thermodesulfobacteriota bacterium]
MLEKFFEYRRLAFLVLTALSVLFLYAIFKDYKHYLAHVSLQEAAVERWDEQGEYTARILSNFFYERRADMQNISRSITINNYYHSRALGMSEEYGLKGRVAHTQKFLQKQSKLWNEQYPGLVERMLFWDRQKGILADFKIGNVEVGLDFEKIVSSDIPQVLVIGKNIPRLVVTAPVMFGNLKKGVVVVFLSGASIRDRFLNARYCSDSCLSILRALDGPWICPAGGNFVSELKCGGKEFARFVARKRKNPDFLTQKQKISGTPLALVRMTAKESFLGHSSPKNILALMLALLILTVVVYIFFIRSFWRNKMLGMQVEQEEKQLKDLDRINKQLEKEIAERSKTEKALRDAEKRFRDIFENANDGIFQSTADGRFLRVNPALARMLKYDSPEDMVNSINGLERDYYVYPRMREKFKEIILRQGKIENFEYEVKCKDGSKLWISENAHCVYETGGRLAYFEGMVRDVSLRKRLEEALVKARDAAEEANRAKSSFLANISHEIRTPLNAIQGMAELLKKSPIGPEERRMAETIFSSAVDLLGIINDLLDLSKIDAKRFKLRYEEIDLPRFCSRIIKPYKHIAREKGLELEIQIDAVPQFVRIDPVRLRQVVTNLIGNSIKFTESGRIDFIVRAESEDEKEICNISFAVRDTGIGIPETELEKIFDDFEQSQSAHTHRMRGTGLGLSLAQKFVQLMGGARIAVTSQEGRGSTFWFDLPLEVSDGSTIRDAESEDWDGEADLSGLKVLAAEDNQVNAELLRRMLGVLGITAPVIVDNGRKVLDVLDEDSSWDLVLLDLEMPVMDGRETTRIIKKNFPGLRVVIMSAHAQADNRADSVFIGADDFVSKPYTLEKLHSVFGRFIADNGLEIENKKESKRETGEASPEESGFDNERVIYRTVRDYLGSEFSMQENEVREIFESTVKSFQSSIEVIEKSRKESDFKDIRKVAHYLKGMFANIALPELSALCKAMQEAAENGDQQQLDQVLSSLKAKGRELLE